MNIGVEFNNKQLLTTALTHSSYANENKNCVNNERLEFLGDSVLSIAISEYIYNKYPKMSEGELSKMRASTVCEKTLAEAARDIGLGKLIRLSKGEVVAGGQERSSILADTFEAVIGAIFLDKGIDAAKKWVLDRLMKYINPQKKIFNDYKTILQEKVQEKKHAVIRYELKSEEGPEHAKKFTSVVYIQDKICGEGCGASKKESEQEAAKDAMNKI